MYCTAFHFLLLHLYIVYVGPTALFQGQLTRSSLGQLANIGDLYDARTDRFTGQSVITGSTASIDINITPMESSQEEFLIDSTSFDRLALLVNDRELQLSVVLDLVQPERYVLALIDQVDIMMSPKNGVLLRTVTTLREQVNSITDVKRLLATCDLTSSEATHVVVGVMWGATVAICLDHIDMQCEETGNDDLRQQLHMVISALQSGARPDFQALSHIKSAYTVRCFSNGLSQSNRPCRTSLEDAVELLLNLPGLTHSVNFGKGSPLSFILMPLSLLSQSMSSMYRRVVESTLTETIAHVRDVTLAKQNLVSFSESVRGRRNYITNQKIVKSDEYVAGFLQAEKTFYKDVGDAIVSVRSDIPNQARLADILRAFSHGQYSVDNVRTFLDSMEPTLQNVKFLDKLIREGIVIIGDSRTVLSNITCNSDVYILYATESAKHRRRGVWEENSCTFLDIIREEKRKHGRTSGKSCITTFAYVDYDLVHGADVDNGTVAIYRYHYGTVVSLSLIHI